jgi:hypothetical protein
MTLLDGCSVFLSVFLVISGIGDLSILATGFGRIN